MKRILSFLFILLLFLTGCTETEIVPEMKQYTATYLTLFDTVTTIVGRAEDEASFQKEAQKIHDELQKYHQLFDIYNEYDGIVNLKTVNEKASLSPIKVEKDIIELLKAGKDFYELSHGRVNIAMGSLLSLWHDARTYGRNNPAEAYLPDTEELEKALEHMDIDTIVIDEEASTVYFSDPSVKLDVGAVAKGWSVQRVAENTPEGMLISVGGNVCATGPKDKNGTPWVIGIQNPDNTENYLHTLNVNKGSVVTSGDYQRAYVVEGELYHHIIDPDTGYPSTYWRAVTVVCEDSGIADMLSTALFLMPLEEGKQLLEQYHAEAMWVDREGDFHYSSGFKKLIRT